MEAQGDFQLALEEAVVKKKQYLENRNLAELRESFTAMNNAFKSLYNVLLRKSLLQEDPYKYDQKLSEIIIPSEKPFAESEKAAQISLRLSEYDNQLEFLQNYYQFTVDFLNLKRIKLLVGLVNYIKWNNLSESSTHMITRSLADLVGKVKQGTDSLSIGIIGDAVNQLSKGSAKILSTLKVLAAFHREVYKLDMRLLVFSKLNLAEGEVTSNPDGVIAKVKRVFAAEMSEQPFYPELVREILNEDFGPQKEYLRQELIKKLEVKEAQPKKQSRSISYNSVLLEAIRTIAASGLYLEDIRRKLVESNMILLNRSMSFGEKFQKWMNKILGRDKEEQMYPVEIFDTATSTTKLEKIDFNEFTETLSKRSKILINLTNKMSTIYKRLESSSEEKIFEFLTFNIEELQLLLRKLPALDTYLKSEIPKELRVKSRGIKLELNAIKNTVVKANQKKHEYVSKKEEIEQLKKLGIKVDAD